MLLVWERKFFNMKKENGKTSLEILITLVISILIVGVIIAMVYEKPKKSTNTNNMVNTTNTQNTVNNSI